MTTLYDVVTRWVDRELGKTDRGNLHGTNIETGEGVIYSYGYHFPLCEAVRDKRGRVVLWLLNGDRYSNSTTRHQSEIRAAVQRTDIPNVIIPFDALQSANVQRSTVQLVDRTDDRWEVKRHSAPSLAEVPNLRADTHEVWEHPGGWKWGKGYFPPSGKRTMETTYYVGWQPVTVHEDGTCTWETHRHWLGESLIRAKVAGRGTRWVYFISGFDHNERVPLYHLSELPGKAETLAEAYESLKPPMVKTAESMGREVKRQGDIFAVPTSLDTRTLTRKGAKRSKRTWMLGTNHRATEVAVLPNGTILARGTMTHDPGGWRRPDHARVSLGRTWHLIIKNTVPVTVN